MTRVRVGRVPLSASSDRRVLSLSSPVDNVIDEMLVEGRDPPRKERSFEEAQGEAGEQRACISCMQHPVRFRTERNDSESMTLNLRDGGITGRGIQVDLQVARPNPVSSSRHRCDKWDKLLEEIPAQEA